MSRRRKPKYADLHRLEEDDRIKAIVARLELGETVAVIVDDHGGKKADRYLEKIRRSIAVVVDYRGPGPTPGAYTLKLTREGN